MKGQRHKIKTYYDKEENIMKELHDIDPTSCVIITNYKDEKVYKEAQEILKSIIDRQEEWINNSLSQTPPDFINETEGYAMEIMRVDDYSKDGKHNGYLSYIKEKTEEAHDFLKEASFFSENIPIIIRPSQEAINGGTYENYFLSFKRTFEKHIKKIKQYKDNFPGKNKYF